MNIRVSHFVDLTEDEVQDVIRQYLDFIIRDRWIEDNHVMEKVYTPHRFDTVVDGGEDASAPKW